MSSARSSSSDWRDPRRIGPKDLLYAVANLCLPATDEGVAYSQRMVAAHGGGWLLMPGIGHDQLDRDLLVTEVGAPGQRPERLTGHGAQFSRYSPVPMPGTLCW